MIRDACEADAAAIREIYRHYAEHTIATFDSAAPDVAAVRTQIGTALARFAWVVADVDGEIVGYAYAGAIRDRPAYDWTCETSVYLRDGLRRSGTGRALMTALLDRLRQRGFRRVLARIAQPNEASVGLHRAIGYRIVGTWEQIGWKHGAWHDVAWLQCDLPGENPSPVGDSSAIPELSGDEDPPSPDDRPNRGLG